MLAWEPMWITIDFGKELEHHFGPQRRQRQETMMEQALGREKDDQLIMRTVTATLDKFAQPTP